jgi:transcriptional regulator with XRE-family HTH domain
VNLNGRGPTIPVPFSVLRERTFAERVKKARVQHGLTQKALSVRAGMSKDSIWRWERGWHGARQRSVERIGDVLGVEAAYLRAGPTT